LVNRFGTSGLVLALWFAVSSELARLSSNALYAVVATPSWHVTQLIAKVELPLLEAIQSATSGTTVPFLAAWVYSAVWLLALLAAVPLSMVTQDKHTAGEVIGSVVMAAVVALPVFALCPVFDPWALSVHLHSSPPNAGVQLLVPRANAAVLSELLATTPWSAGASLPSLHVTFPAVIGMLLRRRGAKVLGMFYTTVAAATSAVVLILGRHWVMDVVSGWVFAWIIARAMHWIVVAGQMPGRAQGATEHEPRQ
jgi:membrane-associated phospholipid phosphatase